MSVPLIVSEIDVQVTGGEFDGGPISRTGRVLREAGVPHILWGCWAAAYNGHTRPSGVSEPFHYPVRSISYLTLNC